MFNDHFLPVSLESSLSCKGSKGFKKEFTVKSDFQHNQIWDIELHASMPLQLITQAWLRQYGAINQVNYQIHNYCLPLWGFSGVMKQIIQKELNKVKSLYWWEANFTSVAEDLNSGLPRTNPASGNGAGFELGPPKCKSIAASFSDQEEKKRANSKERWGMQSNSVENYVVLFPCRKFVCERWRPNWIL